MTPNGGNFEGELSTPYEISTEQRAFYRENGYIKLRAVLTPDLLGHYRTLISSKVAELTQNALPLEQRTTYGKAFLQVNNLWRTDKAIRNFVFNQRLAQMAADLMECFGVRLYHDQALYKEPGGGITPWHADQYYWPLSSDKSITAWIPLQDTPLEMGPLAFCEKSHRLQHGRDLEISDESEMTLKEALQTFSQNNTPYALGDVSFHAGWTFHRAGANSTSQPREVMTVIYIDRDIRLAAAKNKNQAADAASLCPDLKVGEVFDSPLTPILFSY